MLLYFPAPFLEIPKAATGGDLEEGVFLDIFQNSQ